MGISERVKEGVRLMRWVWRHPANRTARVAGLTRLLSWQLTKRLPVARIARLSYGARMHVVRGSVSSSAALYTRGMPDWEEMTFFERYLRPGDTFLDVGANVGLYALLARSRVGAAGAVIAFEPDPRSATELKRNVALNGYDNIEVHEAATSNVAGEVRFTVGLDTIGHIGGEAGGRSVTVASVRLDDVVGERPVAAGKMDIEGAEPLALEGAEKLLRRGQPPVWLLEVNTLLARHEWSPEGLAEWLSQRGFELHVYDAAKNALLRMPEPWRWTPNLFAVRLDRLGEVTKRLGAMEPGAHSAPASNAS